jgi:uncharacterized protein (DUF1697 family)
VTRTARQVALLRAVNVGGRQLPMKPLAALFASLGAEDVRTYVQSGNVVFAGGGRGLARDALERAIEAELGLTVTVLLRTRRELAAVVDANPFLASGADPAALHVTFLAERPEAARVRELPRESGPDELRVHGREVYVHCPNGYGRTKLNNTLVEKRLGVAATTRNWRTVTTLLALCDA